LGDMNESGTDRNNEETKESQETEEKTGVRGRLSRRSVLGGLALAGVVGGWILLNYTEPETTDHPTMGIWVDQDAGESLTMTVVSVGNLDGMYLAAPNGNRSAVFTTDNVLQSGTRFVVSSNLEIDEGLGAEGGEIDLDESDFGDCKIVHSTTGEVMVDGETITFDNSGDIPCEGIPGTGQEGDEITYQMGEYQLIGIIDGQRTVIQSVEVTDAQRKKNETVTEGEG